MVVVVRDYCGEVAIQRHDRDVAAVFDGAARQIMPTGRRAQALWFGRPNALDMLRADVDFDADRAALRWLPDGTHAVELPEAEAIVVVESCTGAVATIPARLARVSVTTLRRAVAEFVATGERPACVAWEP